MKDSLKYFRNIILHVLLWIAVWFFFVYFFSYNSDDRAYVIWFSSFLMPLTASVTYFTVYYLIPRYLMEKKYVKFILYSFYTFVFASYIIAVIIYTCLILLLDYNINLMPPMSKNFFFILVLLYLVVGMVSSISILNHNFTTISRNKELQNKILATSLQLKDQELHYLKRQIHPHFLFNTLNTIYGFALQQSKHTPEIILKLSNLLDYILYQVSKPSVSLREEILHIKEYIELEKFRFQDSLKATFVFDEIDDDTKVAPMLLIPFIENAFKHGSMVDGYLSIDVRVRMEKGGLCFSLINTCINDNPEYKGKGIGMENIRRRLDLHYSNNYKLEQKTEDNKYKIRLSINNINKIQDA